MDYGGIAATQRDYYFYGEAKSKTVEVCCCAAFIFEILLALQLPVTRITSVQYFSSYQNTSPSSNHP